MIALHRHILGGLGILLFLLAWQVAGVNLGPALLAPPSSVLPELFDVVVFDNTIPELFNSLRQMLVGYLLAFVIAMPLGVVMGRSRIADALLHPWVSMLIVTSVAALVPLVVIFVGYGFSFRVAVVFLASVWYMLLTIYQGTRGIDPRYLAVGRSFTANGPQIFFKIILPALLPYVLIAARIGLVHGIRAMVIAELFISHGFGRLLFLAGLEISTAPGLALLLVLMVVSLLANQFLQSASRLLAPWYAEQTKAA